MEIELTGELEWSFRELHRLLGEAAACYANLCAHGVTISDAALLDMVHGDVRSAGESGELLGRVMLEGCRCRCGHEWLPRGSEKPRVCPRCKSPNWGRPKLYERSVVTQ